jgi:hypothetical protein
MLSCCKFQGPDDEKERLLISKVLQHMKVLSFHRIQISHDFALQWRDIDFIKFKKARGVGLRYFTCRTSSAVEWLSVSTSSRTVSWCSFLELFYANLSASDRHRWTAENKQSQESELGPLNRFQKLASWRAFKIFVLWLSLLMIPHNKPAVNIVTCDVAS